MDTMKSDVARLRAQIEEEHAASVWALTGLSEGTARHDFIQHSFEQIALAYQNLVPLIGEQQAAIVLCEVFEQSPAQQKQECMSKKDEEMSNPCIQ